MTEINMNAKYVFRGNGEPARVLCVDGAGAWPVVALSGTGAAFCLSIDGMLSGYGHGPFDIVLAPEPDLVTYAPVYRHSVGGEYIHDDSGKAHDQIGTIRITRSGDRNTLLSVEVV